MFDYRDFGLKKDNLYEILATTFSLGKKKDKIKPNTACMGIRFIEDNILYMGPYPNTTTFKNLKGNGFVGINFVDNIYLYALAALKENNPPIGLTEFPSKYYNYYEIAKCEGNVDIFKNDIDKIIIPYINKAWLSLIGKVVDKNQKIKKNDLGEIRITEFRIIIINFVKAKNSFKYFNRAENLTLETIILATRLKVAKEKIDKILFNNIYEKITEYIDCIKRFGKNKNALKSINLVNNYIRSLMD